MRVVKTRDLAADSFSGSANKDSLYKQILKDAESINDQFLKKLETAGHISTTVNGVVTRIEKNDANYITLDIVIQAGIASDVQIVQIKKAKKTLLDRWGFGLQVIEIP